jgi:hypothetical protein
LRQFLSALILSAAMFMIALAGSMANAESFDSLEGRTQLSASGSAYYSTYSQFQWSAGASAYYYLTPHFGVGGQANLEASNGSYPLYYSIGPSAEYFFPVSDRGQVFGQGGLTVSGQEKSSSTLGLSVNLGYRYFVTDDIALHAKLTETWYKDNDSGGSVRTYGTGLQIGFSLFF